MKFKKQIIMKIIYLIKIIKKQKVKENLNYQLIIKTFAKLMAIFIKIQI